MLRASSFRKTAPAVPGARPSGRRRLVTLGCSVVLLVAGSAAHVPSISADSGPQDGPKYADPIAEAVPVVNARVSGAAAARSAKVPRLPAASSFTNSTPITITDCPSPCPASGQPASLYPSPIAVSGVVGVVERVSVTLNGFSHAFPSDVDMLLVSPSGRKSIVMSDSGAGSPGVSNIALTLDDYAARPLPSLVTGNTGWPFTAGTYRPSNSGTTDQFPAPAPASPYTYTLSAFNGDNPNGTWNLYIVDDANVDSGSISGGWTITFDVRPPAPAAGDVLISEFRTRGEGTAPPGSDGSADEFIELYNNTNASITIIDAVPGADPTLAAGWRFGAAQGAAESTFVVLPQTLSTAGPLAIPPRGHFLLSTQPTVPSPAGNTYSLGAYPTGTGITASGSANLVINPASATVGFLPDDVGLAVFSTASALTAYRLDSVGYSSVTNPDYKEGTGLAPASGITTAGQHSWVRRTVAGAVQDSGNNANDFVLVDTTAATLNGVAAVLGAPGPERGPSATAFTTSSAPIHDPTVNNMPFSVVDPMQAFGNPPNAVYDSTPVTNGALGTVKLRAKFTNNSGSGLIALRYRVVKLSTKAGGAVPAGQADLRVLDSALETVTLTDASTVTSEALTVQTPPAQASGGGLDSSLGEGVVTTTAPLANGASTVVTFTLGVQQYGVIRFAIIAEALNTALQGVSGALEATGSISANGLVVSLGPPTAVAVSSFVARRSVLGVVVRWRATDARTLGFNLYRGHAKLNRHLIPATATAAGSGSAHRFLDRHVRAGRAYTYRLQAVSASGQVQWFGPVSVSATKPALREPRP
jgi:subtilisin-like proprotein convertase family protein